MLWAVFFSDPSHLDFSVCQDILRWEPGKHQDTSSTLNNSAVSRRHHRLMKTIVVQSVVLLMSSKASLTSCTSSQCGGQARICRVFDATFCTRYQCNQRIVQRVNSQEQHELCFPIQALRFDHVDLKALNHTLVSCCSCFIV